MNFSGARDYIIKRLEDELNPRLFYHSLKHTADVHQAVLYLIKNENTDDTTGKLIETAALFHDSGMMIRYRDHEELSAEIASSVLPRFGFSPEQINIICRYIMATKMPQKASDQGEKILCDADLDSLGRDDFFIQSISLWTEWKEFGIADYSLRKWFELQIEFLENHHYFTVSAQNARELQKKKNISEIKNLFL